MTNRVLRRIENHPSPPAPLPQGARGAGNSRPSPTELWMSRGATGEARPLGPALEAGGSPVPMPLDVQRNTLASRRRPTLSNAERAPGFQTTILPSPLEGEGPGVRGPSLPTHFRATGTSPSKTTTRSTPGATGGGFEPPVRLPLEVRCRLTTHHQVTDGTRSPRRVPNVLLLPSPLEGEGPGVRGLLQTRTRSRGTPPSKTSASQRTP